MGVSPRTCGEAFYGINSLRAFSPQFAVRLRRGGPVWIHTTNEYKVEWALGWRIVTTRDGFLSGPSGDNPGFYCRSEACPARKCGFVIMTNGDKGVKLIQRVVPSIQAGIYV